MDDRKAPWDDCPDVVYFPEEIIQEDYNFVYNLFYRLGEKQLDRLLNCYHMRLGNVAPDINSPYWYKVKLTTNKLIGKSVEGLYLNLEKLEVDQKVLEKIRNRFTITARDFFVIQFRLVLDLTLKTVNWKVMLRDLGIDLSLVNMDLQDITERSSYIVDFILEKHIDEDFVRWILDHNPHWMCLGFAKKYYPELV